MVGRIQRVAHHAWRDFSRDGELTHFEQIRIGAHVHTFDTSLASDDVGKGGVDAAADTDGEVGTTESQRFDAEFGGGIETDEVEAGTCSVWQGARYLFWCNRYIRLAFESEGTRCGVGVDRYHSSGRDGFDDLHGEVTEATNSEDHHGVTGSNHCGCLLARSVSSKSCIGECGELGKIRRRRHLEHRTLIGQQILGVTTIHGDAGRSAVRRIGVEPCALLNAQAIADERETDHRVANGNGGHARTDLVDVSSIFMTKNQGERWHHFTGQQVQVGSTHASRGNSHHHIGGLDDSWRWDLFKIEWCSFERGDHRLHDHCTHHVPPLVIADYNLGLMCTTGVLHFADGSYALFKNKDFGRIHLDDRLWLDRDLFGVLGMTTWAGDDPAKDEYSGFSVGANSAGLLVCDSNVVTLDGLVNYDVMTEVALREGTDVRSAAEAVREACAANETSWGNLVMIDANGAASVEIRGNEARIVPLSGPSARSNHHVVLGPHELQADTMTTEKRRASAQRQVSAANSIDDLFRLQASHDDGDTGVCNHSDLNTVYSYVLHRKAGKTTLYVLQGRPCSGEQRVAITIPFGDDYSNDAATWFLAAYPTATKANFAVVA